MKKTAVFDVIEKYPDNTEELKHLSEKVAELHADFITEYLITNRALTGQKEVSIDSFIKSIESV